MKHLLAISVLFALSSSCNGVKQKKFSKEEDERMVAEILKNLDSHTVDMDTKLSVYSKDIVHMGPGNKPITNLEDLRKMLTEERKWGHSEMKHEAYEIHSYEDHVIVRGGVNGTWIAKDGSTQIPFKTNNLITLKRNEEGELRIWHVIFNRIED